MASNQSLSLSYPSFFLSVAASASAGFLLAYKILRMSTKEMAVKVAEEAKKDLGSNTDGQFARATMSASGHRETAPELAEERQKVQARIAKMSRSEFEAFKKNELPELSAKGVL